MIDDFERVRAFTRGLAEPLSADDMSAQSMTDASPAKWHLAHTTWFFETFVLGAEPGYAPVHPKYSYLFNSYYNAVGARHERSQRGLLTRPSARDVLEYRAEVNRRMRALLPRLDSAARKVVEIGLHHEQQHQELLLTDLLHLFSHNALDPVYQPGELAPSSAPRGSWTSHAGGIVHVGRDPAGFCFDNEGPRHRVFLESFELADDLVSNAEYRAFIEDGGYERPELWMDLGLATARTEGWSGPLYWRDGAEFTLRGLVERDPHAPVTHLSWFEADAYARWAGARLPTEFEWEAIAGDDEPSDGFVEDGTLRARQGSNRLGQLWQWTASAYAPYPGYCAAEGALGEYNGKFMSQQYVLRGGSVATSRSHIRATYRNFFPPSARWQFTGIRLAR